MLSVTRISNNPMTQLKRNHIKKQNLDQILGFWTFPVVKIYSVGRGIQFSGQNLAIPASRGQNIGKTTLEKMLFKFDHLFLNLFFLFLSFVYSFKGLIGRHILMITAPATSGQNWPLCWRHIWPPLAPTVCEAITYPSAFMPR